MLGFKKMVHEHRDNSDFHFAGDDLIVTPRLVIPGALLDFSFARASGPGGQNVNKKSTKCVLRVRVAALPIQLDQQSRLSILAGHLLTDSGDLLISCDEHRSAPRNKAECLDRLRTLIARCLVAPKARKATKPTRGSKERRLSAKRIASDRKRGRRGGDDD
jgi:ribosome-associated protein